MTSPRAKVPAAPVTLGELKAEYAKLKDDLAYCRAYYRLELRSLHDRRVMMRRVGRRLAAVHKQIQARRPKRRATAREVSNG